MVHDFTVDELRLNRYDGYNFKVFGNDPFNAFSLAENTVTALFEDSRGWLWVGTDSKGVDVYDRRSGRFHHFPLNFKYNDDAGSTDVFEICEAPDGSMYMLQSSNGLVTVFDFPKSLVPDWMAVKRAANKSFLVAVSNRLWLLSPGEIPDFSKPDWVIDTRIASLETDRNGNIWVGTQGYGLRKLNLQKRSFHTGAIGTSIWGLWRNNRGQYLCKVVNEVYPYDPVSGKIGAERAYPQLSKRILDICMEPAGAMWLLGRGDQENGRAELWRHDPESGLSQLYPFEFSLYVYARLLRSRSGQLWMTGLNCRLARFDPQTARFEYFDYASLFGEKANSVRTFALTEDGNGILWIGTQQGLIKGVPLRSRHPFSSLG